MIKLGAAPTMLVQRVFIQVDTYIALSTSNDDISPDGVYIGGYGLRKKESCKD